jgi:glutamate-1-semialdehyde aminotransferase/spore coat polysaccharide biosynthesis protein SpsF (cytidylyltransferase family)
MVKVIAITQARANSTRLPKKILKQINGKSLLQIHLERLKQSKLVSKFIVATTHELEAIEIERIAGENGFETYKGSTEDVLDRFYNACKNYSADLIVRITSDCPLIDGSVIDEVVDHCIQNKLEYCSNTLDPSFPDGLDVEVFSFNALQIAWHEATDRSDREHVTPFIWRNSTYKGGEMFKSDNVKYDMDFSDFRVTVDELKDFELIKNLINSLGDKRNWKEYVAFLESNPAIFNINSHIKRNEGYMKTIETDNIQLRQISNFHNSDLYRAKIHSLIPGGSHTYSKGDDQFPKLSPAAIKKGKGAYLWDIDDNKFLDCSMGLTSVSLGHAYEPVINRVKEELNNGVNFQRPSDLEMETAEKFLSLVPQHQMIKFAKNGSTVTSAAVKLARTYTGKKLVAFPYDHPFYSYDDWFIGKTACNAGIPDEISALSVTYKSDDLKSLTDLFEKYPGQIACVISEPERNWGIPENYLYDAIALTHKNGALYIVDEMITGFKTDLPGSIKKFGVTPDMATWGKGIANGFSFCALTGTKEIMELGGIRNTGAEKVFLISTTHGGETHSLAASLATIEEFEKHNVIEHNHSIGKYFIQLCSEVIKNNDMEEFVEISPSHWFPVFIFRDKNKEISPGLRTLSMQEMIKRGVLFQGAFSPCFSHTKDDVKYFASALNETLNVYEQALDKGYEKYLVGDIAKPVFRKYL